MANRSAFEDGSESGRANLPFSRRGGLVVGIGLALASLVSVSGEAQAFHRHRYVGPPVVHRHHVYRAPIYRSYHYCPPVYHHYRPHTYHHYRAPVYCPPVRHYYPPAVRYRYGAPYCYPGYGYSYSYGYGYGFPISWTTTLPIGFGFVPVGGFGGGFGGGAVRDEGSIALLRQNADLGSDIYSPSRSTLPSRPLATAPAPVAGQGLFASQETQTVVDLVARVAESVRDAREARGVAGDGKSLADRESAAPRRPLLAAAARAIAGSGRLAEAPAEKLPLETRGDNPREGDVRDSGVRENGGRESAIRDGEQAGNVPQASSDAARRRAAKYVQQGDQLFARGRYLEAMSVYQRAAESTPDAAQPLVRQGLAYLAAKRYERAADVIRRGLRLEPDYAASGFRLRHLYGGDSVAKSEHLEALAAAANADPGNSDLPLLAAIFLHYDGQSERAEPFFAESRERGGEAAQFVAMFK